MSKLLEEINNQVFYELESEIIYLAISGQYAPNYAGITNFFIVQAHEERIHAMKFYKYLAQNGKKITLRNIELPKFDYSDLIKGFEDGLEHEKFITERIHLLMQLAIDENNQPAIEMLNWFVDEQQEEEESFTEILHKIDTGVSYEELDKGFAERDLNYKVQFKM